MAVTMQQVAELAGVSRGTVDRVLHGRPNVDAVVREKVLRAQRTIMRSHPPPLFPLILRKTKAIF